MSMMSCSILFVFSHLCCANVFVHWIRRPRWLLRLQTDQSVRSFCRLYRMRSEHLCGRLRQSRADRVTGVIHTLTRCFRGRNSAGNARGIIVEIRIVIESVDVFISGFTLSKQTGTGRQNAAFLDLRLASLWIYFPVITMLRKIAFCGRYSNHSIPAGGNASFISGHGFEMCPCHGKSPMI